MADTLPSDAPCDACGCPGIAHDGVGCTICPPTDCDRTGDDFLEKPPVGMVPNTTGLSVMELDVMHANVGLGPVWQGSERRAELLADEERRTVTYPFCDRCQAFAAPTHTHEEPAHAQHR